MTKEKVEPILNSVFYGIVVESYVDTHKKKGKVRVRPVPHQGIPPSLHVSCSQEKRKAFPVGTRFKLDIKVCQKSKGRFYLSSLKPSVLLTEEAYGKKIPLARQLYLKFS